MFLVNLFIVLTLSAISNAQTSDNCTVFKSQNRTCYSGTNCQTSQSDTQQFNICPVLTSSEINSVVSNRANQTSEQLNQITNQTSEALANVRAVYASRIATSTGFGYIAGAFMGIIFLVPAVFDIMNAITGKNLAKRPRRTGRIRRLRYINH